MKHLILHNPLYQSLVKDFRAYLKITGYNPISQKALPSHLQEFFYQLEYCGVDQLKHILPCHITAYHNYLSQRPCHTKPGGLSQSMINNHLYTLRLFFDYAQSTEEIIENPLSCLNFPKPETKLPEIFTQEEIKELYKACITLLDKAILGLLYGCGLRVSEAAKLNTTDISYRQQLLYVREGKGKKRRVIPLSSRVCHDLKNYYHNERNSYISNTSCSTQSAFILSKKGNRMHPGTYGVYLKNLLKQTTIQKRIYPHCLRHSIASHFIENKLSMERVSEFLGHESIDTTQIYTHINLVKTL